MRRIEVALVEQEFVPVADRREGGSPELGTRGTLSSMGLAEAFQEIVDSLPDDWTDLEIDPRFADEERYIDAAVLLTQVNAQPYSRADWHWRVLVAHRFGHAAAAETVKGTLPCSTGRGSRARWWSRGAGGAGGGRPDVGAAGERAARVSPQPKPLTRAVARVVARSPT